MLDDKPRFDAGSALAAGAVSAHEVPTASLSRGLRRRVASSTVISVSSQAVQFLIMFVATVILARLLPPQDFGRVAMVLAVLGYFRIFKDAGLSVATIQREGITHAQVSNLFWINAASSAAAALLFAVSAPAIAWFYRDPDLAAVAVVLAATFVFSGLTVQHMALLSRQMRFKSIAVVQIIATGAGTATGIALALWDYGYWALVAMQIATPLVALLGAWWACSWRPGWPSRGAGTWPLVKFGANLTATNLVYYVARGLDALLLGRVYGAAAVGLYTRAAALLVRPLDNFLAPVHAVFVPVLSRLQGDVDRYRRVFLQAFEAIALVCFVMSAMLLPLAHPLTLVLLGTNWEAAAPIFAGFAMLGLAYPPCYASTWLFASQGRGGDFFLATACVSALTVAAFVAGLPYGPQGVAIVFSATNLLLILPVYFYFAGRAGPITRRDLFRGFLRHLPVWVAVAATTFVAHRLTLDAAPWLQLAIGLPAGLIAGAAFVFAYRPARRTAHNLLRTLVALQRPASELDPTVPVPD